MFCKKCGEEIEKGNDFCMNCGTKIEKTEKKVKIQKNRCEFCGNEMLESEKFCIHCGKTANGQTINETQNKSTLKQELQKVFSKNKLLSILANFGVVFALYYPIKLILDSLAIAPDLVEILEYVNIIMFYGYYIALISLYANKKYMPLMLAMILRITNSIIIICEDGASAASIERIIIILIALFYVFQEFRKTQHYQEFENKYKTMKTNIEAEIKVTTCEKCGEKVSESSVFCPKCGSKM